MNKYYNFFVKENKKLMNQIYSKLKEENIFTDFLNNKKVFCKLKINLNEKIEVDIEIDPYKEKINIISDLNTISLNLTYNVNEIKKDQIKIKSPEIITITKKGYNGCGERMQFSEKNSSMIIYEEYRRNYCVLSIDNAGEIISNTFRSLENINNKDYLFLSNIEKIKMYYNNYHEVLDYLFMYKDLKKETKDHLLVLLDISEKTIDNFNKVKMSISDFYYSMSYKNINSEEEMKKIEDLLKEYKIDNEFNEEINMFVKKMKMIK